MSLDDSTRWNQERPLEAHKLALLGATDVIIAKEMGISIGTFSLWKKNKREFAIALEKGRTMADADVASSLYKMAMGYWGKETVVHVFKGEEIVTTVDKYYPPNAWAANKWLSIRQKPLWGDTSKHEQPQQNQLNVFNFNSIDLTGVSTEELMLLKSIGLKAIEGGGN